MWNESDLAALATTVDEKRRAEATIAAHIRHLRGNGCPWSVIAERLGVSKQAAAKKYGPSVAIATPPGAEAAHIVAVADALGQERLSADGRWRYVPGSGWTAV